MDSLALLFPIKEGSTSLTKPLSCPKREGVTALRCSEPLRYKVGGPIKGLAMLCGLGPHGEGGYSEIIEVNFLINLLITV